MRVWSLPASLAAIVVALAACTSAGPTPQAAAGEAAQPVDSPLGSYLAGRVAAELRDTGAAARFYRQALAEDTGNALLLQRTFLLTVTEGDFEQSTALARRQLAARPDLPLARLALAVEAIRAGDKADAAAQVAASARDGMGGLMMPILEAWLAQDAGDVAAAQAALAALAGEQGFAPFRLFHEALILDAAGRTDAADRAYAATRDTQAGNATRVVQAYASHLARTGRREAAIDLLHAHRGRFPDNPAVEATLQRLDDGRDPARPIADAREGIAEALYGVAAALATERSNETGRAYLQLALRLRPDFGNAQMLLAEMLESDQRWAEASEVYRTVPGDSPYSWEARIRTASTLARQDETDQAVALLEELGAERPKDARPMIALADLLRARERYDAAIPAYDRAVERVGTLQQRDWTLLYSRGIALERAGQWERAEADFLRALELEPEQPLVLNYLGYSWVEKGRHLERALEMIERAVEQRSTDGYIVDSLGWAKYRLGRFADAVRHLERAVELRPEDPVINDHLGDAYWQVGRRLEARFQWNHALALDPEPGDRETIMAKLESGLHTTRAAAD